VLTVDHGLVPGSARIAEEVVAKAQTLGLNAHILSWRGRKPASDIESAARAARYRLMGNWCDLREIRALYVAHTLEDQAETFLLRLARGSGVDGLAAMPRIAPFPVSGFGHIRVVRPLLAVPRARLRALLSARNLDWHEDEMNCDPRFARVRLRAAWPSFAEAGLTMERIAAAATHLARARTALDHNVVAFLGEFSRVDGNQMLVDGAALASAPSEIGLRVLAHVLMAVSKREYRPRFERLKSLYEAICAETLKGGRTLHGCAVKVAPKRHRCFGPRTVTTGPEPGRDGRC
jgi:tRNA(Ile)-lysidine synthase